MTTTTGTHELAEDMRASLRSSDNVTPDHSCEYVDLWRSVFYVTNSVTGERFRVTVESIS